VKTGMLHTHAVVTAVAERIEEEELPLVVDPVMVATSGDKLAAPGLEAALAKLARVATLVTPNVAELEALTGTGVRNASEAKRAAQLLLRRGWSAVLVKGGHLAGPEAVDVLFTASGAHELAYPRVPGPFHGAGCHYASLIAGLLARGHGLDHAVTEARARMHRAIARAYAVGEGPRVLDALEMVEPGDAQGAPLSAAAWQIAATLPLALVPEVGINCAWLPDGAGAASDAYALSRRIVRSARGASPPGPVVRGGSSHVARLLLAAHEMRPDVRCAMNLAYSPSHVEAAQGAGMKVAWFARDEEPAYVGTMEWGTTSALKATTGPVDLVVDEGAPGKEAMMRLLARDPGDLVAKVRALAKVIS
jgi:hydroxymethylpyrimidine/phosphomethylpyrimidine kinase